MAQVDRILVNLGALAAERTITTTHGGDEILSARLVLRRSCKDVVHLLGGGEHVFELRKYESVYWAHRVLVGQLEGERWSVVIAETKGSLQVKGERDI